MPGAAASYEFGPFRLEPAQRRLFRGTDRVAIPPNAFDLLVILVEQPDRLLKKEELVERLWPGETRARSRDRLDVGVAPLAACSCCPSGC